MCLKAHPGFEAKSISSKQAKNTQAVKKWMIMEGLSNSCLTLGTSRDVGLGLGKSPYPAPVVVNFLKIKNFSKNRKQQLKGGAHTLN